MPFLTAPDGVRLHYNVSGDGPPLLLHLGAGCEASIWSEAGYIGPLAKRYRCILFDDRGHGRSDCPRDVTADHIDRYVADVVALLDHLKLSTVSFWGYSNGGTVGLAVAERYPDRISAWIMSGALSKPTDPDNLRRAGERRIRSLQEGGWDWLIHTFETEEGEVPGWMKDRLRATDLEQFILWIRARPDWKWNPWDLLIRLRSPALVPHFRPSRRRRPPRHRSR